VNNSFAPSPLAVNIITVERRITGPVDPTGVNGDPTGEGVPATFLVVSGLNCGIGPYDVRSGAGGNLQYYIEGQVYEADHELYVQGLAPIDFFPASGGSVVFVAWNPGIPYTVNNTLLGAYPDIQVGDRVTDENATQYLVLARHAYYDIQPNLQLRMAQGKAWQT
jgi:hypothetical protein